MSTIGARENAHLIDDQVDRSRPTVDYQSCVCEGRGRKSLLIVVRAAGETASDNDGGAHGRGFSRIIESPGRSMINR